MRFSLALAFTEVLDLQVSEKFVNAFKKLENHLFQNNHDFKACQGKALNDIGRAYG